MKQGFAGSASSGGARLLLSSLAVLLLLLLYTLLFASQFSWWLGIAYMASLLAAFLGWAKLAEPKYSLELDEYGIRYCHRAGSCRLDFSAFAYCAVPELDGKPLAFIGFKITDFDALLQQLPLRLAVRMMTEQRPLYLEAIRQSCASGQCATELLKEKDFFNSGKQRYGGVRAAFAQRMQRLAEACGFEFMVPVNVPAEVAQQWCQAINKQRLASLQTGN